MTEVRMKAIAKCILVSAIAVAMTSCGGPAASSPVSPVLSVSDLKGNYVYAVTGVDSTDGDYVVLGSFVADGTGKITSAVADYNLGSGIDANVPLTGTYTVDGTGTATVHLKDSGAIFDSFTTQVGKSTSTPISNFDANGSGTLYPQVTTGFSTAGSYTYTIAGEGQGTVTGNGQFVVGAGNTFSSGALSYTDAQTVKTYNPVSGFLYVPGGGGRGQAALEGHNLAYYVVGPSQLLMIGLDARALLSITATKQKQ